MFACERAAWIAIVEVSTYPVEASFYVTPPGADASPLPLPPLLPREPQTTERLYAAG